MQQWLKKLVEREILLRYMSVRYGEKDVYGVRCGKIMKWVEGDGKVDT